MSKSFSSDNFRKGKLYGKLMTGVILLFFVLLLGVVNTSAIECPPGFKWVRMSGVGCVQENCMEIENAKLSYTGSCICNDGYKGCYESVDYTNFDTSKCFPNCPGARLVACVKPDEPCPPKEDCRDYCNKKFSQEQPEFLSLFESRGKYPFCYCVCIDERTGENVSCWVADWDCEDYCSKKYEHGMWDSVSDWPDCGCICEKGWGMKETGCVACDDICKETGEHYVYDPDESDDNICECKCEEGYEDSYSEKCEKVECPVNSTNVAELGGSCPKDREELNRHCCCDAGYVKWYGICIKEEDVPGKVVCGKWGCQEGEDCINCPADCGCIAPEICDPFSEYADPEDKCSPKVAYIFISSEIDTYEYYWILYKINHIQKYYRSLGYKTITVRVNNLHDVVDKLSNPSTKAVAYFGHAIEPSIEYSDATGIRNLMYQTLYTKYQYPASGINDEEARRRASERSARPNLDYAYIHTCSSLNDTSLADYLLHSGGTYWGEKDKLYAVEWLDKYVKP